MRKENKWSVVATREAAGRSPDVLAVSKELGLTVPTAQLLVNRGCTTPEKVRAFLGKTEEMLHDPFLMRDMDSAVYRIAEAIEEGEKIVIFGDYDVDGVTSVSCLYLYLKKHGACVSYYIPSRSGEGYGMSGTAVRKLAAEGCRLIITVDTGITAADEIELARSLGVDVIVTDHHECHEIIPDAVAVINPRRRDCEYPFKELAGVGVVFKLLCALESVLDTESEMIDCVRRVSREYCDLVAIGTVADVMAVRDENRLIVRYGLSLINETERAGLAELIDVTAAESKNSKKKRITASFIGFTIAPRINAAGRIANASIAVELFLAEERETAAPIARQLCDINRERQARENAIVEEAYAKITAEHDFERDPVVILDDEEWHHGIIGIVASRITEKYSCPSILISFEGSERGDVGKGSGRSVKGLNLVDALADCSDLLEKYGGHELAVGLTIKKENLPEFRRRLNEYAREKLAEGVPEVVLEAECELSPEDVTLEQANELFELEPFGVSNPVPVFVMYNVPLYATALVGGGKHSRLTLRIGSSLVSAMFFRRTLSELDLYPGDNVDVMFLLDINDFRDQKSVQLIVKDVRLTETDAVREKVEHELYDRICSALGGGRAGDGDLSIGESVPTRDDFAAVYSLLRRELKVEHEIFSIRALLNILAQSGCPVGYVKLRFILEILDELQLIGVTEVDREYEIFSFKFIVQSGKTSLDSSTLYSRLKTLA